MQSLPHSKPEKPVFLLHPGRKWQEERQRQNFLHTPKCY